MQFSGLSVKKKERQGRKTMMTTDQPPVLALDLKKKRIRIHKQTLHQLNDPEYIQILVNPDKKIIAIRACEKNALQAHKISYVASKDCELYSKGLLAQLAVVSPELTEGNTYRLNGIIHHDRRIAVFYMDQKII